MALLHAYVNVYEDNNQPTSSCSPCNFSATKIARSHHHIRDEMTCAVIFENVGDISKEDCSEYKCTCLHVKYFTSVQLSALYYIIGSVKEWLINSETVTKL